MTFQTVAVLIAALLSAAANAQSDVDPGTVRADQSLIASPPPMFTFGGFGTFGEVHSSRHDGDYTSTSLKPNGAGYSHNWSSDVDSLIAGQITANFSSQWSAVVQVVSEQDYENSYRPSLEWANVKYKFDADFDVRIGRTPLDTVMSNETRKLGYANPWVRPPLEVYDLVPVIRNDGLDLSYRHLVGPGTNTLHLAVGRSDSDLPLLPGTVGVIHGRKQLILTELYEQGFASARVNYSRANVTINGLEPPFDTFNAFGPAGAAIAANYSFDNHVVNIYAVGASYDPENWFVMAEWGHIQAGSFTGNNTGWYVSGGYRIHGFTPYLTYAAATTSTTTQPAGLNVAALPPSLAPAATALNAELDFQLASIRAQHTISAGTRWDFARNVALKFQLDHTRVDAGAHAVNQDLQPGFPTGGTLNLISVSIDFVF